MLILVITTSVIGYCVWLVVRGWRRLFQAKARWLWWVAFAAIQIAGGAVGYQLAFGEMEISSTFRWAGIPFPIGFFHWEDGHWVDFIPPEITQWFNGVADTCVPIVLLMLLWATISKRYYRRKPENYG